MLFWIEESFWGTDGDTAVKETEKKKSERQFSGKNNKHCRKCWNDEEISFISD